MADLFWPGDERAGTVFDEAAFLTAMARVETAWLAALAVAGIARVDTTVDLTALVGPDDVEVVAAAAESGGNPVLPMLELLRSRTDRDTGAWLHRGLTSQDVVDTALMVCARDAIDRVLAEVDQHTVRLAELAAAHRTTVMAGRTLTQHAVPVTFGLTAARWLTGVLDARDALAAVDTPAQLGGAAGTSAAAVEIARLSGADDPAKVALELTAETAAALGLTDRSPWHTTRAPVTAIGDALVTATDAWGHIANDVLLLGRPEVGEVSEPSRGGSSTMPHKANPVLSMLIRRAALTGPGLTAQLHLAAAASVDERSDGAWQVEWSTLATLARRTVVAASQTTELLAGLEVHADRMAATVASAVDALLSEQRSIATKAGVDDGPADPASYLGLNDHFIDAALARHQETRP
jgi:3-carboxy-cis,cis-muconate cycloisomerase